MEETVKIILFGQEKIITKESITKLEPLINDDHFRLIRLPPILEKFKADMKVLHSCLYYILAVQKQLDLSRSFDFRQKCLSNISQYYIRQKMNFQLYEYGYLCSKILSIPLDKVMHVIYYLVFARLASKPFIKNMIVEMEIKIRQSKNKTTMKSQKQYSIQSKSQDSRHFTVFCDANGTETQSLRRQLKKIMNPQTAQCKKMTKRMDNRRYFNIRKLYPNDSEFKEELEEKVVAQYRSTATSRVACIPNKVSNRQNSSVITRLKFNSGAGSQDNLFKKVQVRKQKFSQKFQSTQKYSKLISSKTSKENKKPEKIQSIQTVDKDAKGSYHPYRIQKNAFQYFQGVASNIRTKNEQFDMIRFSCMNHKERNKYSCKQPHGLCSFNRDSMMSRHEMKTQGNKRESLPQPQMKMETNRQNIKKDIKKQDYFSAFTDKQRDQGKMTKTISQGKFAEIILQQFFMGSITRKNDSVMTDDDQIVLFNRKLTNKFKLQKYKQEYQSFLKTQLFQKSKETI